MRYDARDFGRQIHRAMEIEEKIWKRWEDMAAKGIVRIFQYEIEILDIKAYNEYCDAERDKANRARPESLGRGSDDVSIARIAFSSSIQNK